MVFQILQPITSRHLKEKEILDKHWIFNKSKNIQHTCMVWGLDCDEGWYSIIDQLCSDIEQFIETQHPEYRTNEYPFSVEQVKEKFGGLRFYTSFSDDEINKLIREAEDKCSKTCERCGNKGKLRDYGWLKTLCEKHWKTLKIKRGL